MEETDYGRPLHRRHPTQPHPSASINPLAVLPSFSLIHTLNFIISLPLPFSPVFPRGYHLYYRAHITVVRNPAFHLASPPPHPGSRLDLLDRYLLPPSNTTTTAHSHLKIFRTVPLTQAGP